MYFGKGIGIIAKARLLLRETYFANKMLTYTEKVLKWTQMGENSH